MIKNKDIAFPKYFTLAENFTRFSISSDVNFSFLVIWHAGAGKSINALLIELISFPVIKKKSPDRETAVSPNDSAYRRDFLFLFCLTDSCRQVA